MSKKPRVKHGTYIENPKCEVCGGDVRHDWLDGDYTLIICDKQECLDTLDDMSQSEFNEMIIKPKNLQRPWTY